MQVIYLLQMQLLNVNSKINLLNTINNLTYNANQIKLIVIKTLNVLDTKE